MNFLNFVLIIVLVSMTVCVYPSVSSAGRTNTPISEWCGEKFGRLFTELAIEKTRILKEAEETRDEIRFNILAGQWLGIDLIERQAKKAQNEHCS